MKNEKGVENASVFEHIYKLTGHFIDLTPRAGYQSRERSNRGAGLGRAIAQGMVYGTPILDTPWLLPGT